MLDDKAIAAIEAHANSISVPNNGPIAKRKRPLDKTDMTYWFPLIEAAGLPVPKTMFVEMTDTGRRLIWDIFDGVDSGNGPEPFFAEIEKAATEIGYPCFLRTGHTSNKHSWKSTCFLESPAEIPAHVLAIAEFSECADMMGLPWDTWAVRELLPIIPYGHCSRYGDMPVNREFRFFVDGDRYLCHHPYWPFHALEQGGWEVDVTEDVAYLELCDLKDNEFEELKALAIRAGVACCGAWSVDFLETERGWYLTDMAEANRSFHWEGCKNGR